MKKGKAEKMCDVFMRWLNKNIDSLLRKLRVAGATLAICSLLLMVAEVVARFIWAD